MIVGPKTKIDDLLREYPFLEDFLLGRSAKFRLLKNPLMRSTVGRLTTLDQMAAIGSIDVRELLQELAAEISRERGEEIMVECKASEAALRPSTVPPAIPLDTGYLTPEELNLILTSLPADLTFVNERDEIVYYSQTKRLLFPRNPGIIGGSVQDCHPRKSLEMVQKILDEFRAGGKDVAEFWVQVKGRFIHIRYFAIRDAAGAYRGTLEMSQDVTAIRNLAGEKKDLEWE